MSKNKNSSPFKTFKQYLKSLSNRESKVAIQNILFLCLILFILIKIYKRYSEKFDDESPFLNTMFEPVTKNYVNFHQHNEKHNNKHQEKYEENFSQVEGQEKIAKKGESKGEIICKETNNNH